ncbi:MAG: FtsX-like permease family protein [Cyclobacteriaceae bacterium]
MMKRWADRLFRWYCHPDYYPDIKGDLEELYDRHVESGVKSPELKYVMDVLMLFRLSLIRPVLTNSIINTAMILNYLKVSMRNLLRHKVYASINIIGLAIGLSGFLLISQYVSFENSYDRFFDNPDQLYRISTIELAEGGVQVKDAMTSYSTGEVLENEIPEIVSHTVTKKISEVILRNGNVVFKENATISADSAFLDHFTYKVIHGDKDALFSDPLSVVLTESKAKTYFGDVNPVGKTLRLLSPMKASLNVTGVIEDVPPNTHYNFDIMISDKSLAEMNDYKNWNYTNYYVYVKVRPDADMAQLDEKINVQVKKIYGDDTTDRWDINAVKDIYLTSDYTYEPQIQGNAKTVGFLRIISLLILAIAMINYINLSTARAVDRAKEVGLRKVVGAYKYQLIIQFLFESFLVNLLGAFLALVLSELLLDYFNQLVGKQLVENIWNNGPFLIKLVLFVSVGTIISGIYPAIVLSGYKPVTVLKGKYSHSKSGILLRKALVITQFSASLVLIAATLVVFRQVNFMKHKDMGIDIDHVLTVSVPRSGANTQEEYDVYVKKFNSLKNEFKNFSAITSIGGTSCLPGSENSEISSTTNKMMIVGMSDPYQATTYLQWIDEGFIETMDLDMIAGRGFEKSRGSDSSAILVNESFLSRMSIKDISEVVGKKLKMGDDDDDPDFFNIIGVVSDFNRTSLKSSVEPTLYLPNYNARDLVIKVQPGQYSESVDFLESKWDDYFPGSPFIYSFIDEKYALLYDQDERFGNVFAVFSGFAILVAMMGLFGLVSFMAVQRTKEVGIRKVLGASIGNIIAIFYRDFIILLLLSAVIGIPAVYLSMSSWLDNYAYRIDFPWLLALLSLLVISVFALVTVGYQTYKVAILDPSKTLKYE